MCMKQIPIKLLRRMLKYDKHTGKLYWKRRSIDMFSGARAKNSCNAWNSKWAGKEAFTSIDSHGYHHGCLNNSPFKAHRVVWALCYGQWPTVGIDHKDHCRTNNKLDNLLLATQKDNMQNKINNTNIEGVSWHQQQNKFKVVVNNEIKCFCNSLEEGRILYNRFTGKTKRRKLPQHK
mgnify:CR=1 FL=1